MAISIAGVRFHNSQTLERYLTMSEMPLVSHSLLDALVGAALSALPPTQRRYPNSLNFLSYFVFPKTFNSSVF